MEGTGGSRVAPQFLMAKVEQLTFPGADALAQAVAAEWLRELAGARAPYCVALSGGRIARRFLSAVAVQAKHRRSVFDSVRFFWSDERCVPPDDPESNFRLAQESLLGPLAIRESQIHRLRGELPPKTAAAQAGADLRSILPTGPGGQPVLDLVFLGLGEDGHVASLFPGESEEASSSPAIFRDVVGTKPPPHRLTMGYATLAAAHQVWVLVSGSGKAGALRNSLLERGQTPLARVLRMRSMTRLFVEASATT